MAAFFDNMPLIAGINEDWDENTTGNFMPAEKSAVMLNDSQPNNAMRIHPALTC